MRNGERSTLLGQKCRAQGLDRKSLPVSLGRLLALLLDEVCAGQGQLSTSYQVPVRPYTALLEFMAETGTGGKGVFLSLLWPWDTCQGGELCRLLSDPTPNPNQSLLDRNWDPIWP